MTFFTKGEAIGENITSLLFLDLTEAKYAAEKLRTAWRRTIETPEDETQFWEQTIELHGFVPRGYKYWGNTPTTPGWYGIAKLLYAVWILGAHFEKPFLHDPVKPFRRLCFILTPLAPSGKKSVYEVMEEELSRLGARVRYPVAITPPPAEVLEKVSKRELGFLKTRLFFLLFGDCRGVMSEALALRALVDPQGITRIIEGHTDKVLIYSPLIEGRTDGVRALTRAGIHVPRLDSFEGLPPKPLFPNDLARACARLILEDQAEEAAKLAACAFTSNNLTDAGWSSAEAGYRIHQHDALTPENPFMSSEEFLKAVNRYEEQLLSLKPRSPGMDLLTQVKKYVEGNPPGGFLWCGIEVPRIDFPALLAAAYRIAARKKRYGICRRILQTYMNIEWAHMNRKFTLVPPERPVVRIPEVEVFTDEFVNGFGSRIWKLSPETWTGRVSPQWMTIHQKLILGTFAADRFTRTFGFPFVPGRYGIIRTGDVKTPTLRSLLKVAGLVLRVAEKAEFLEKRDLDFLLAFGFHLAAEAARVNRVVRRVLPLDVTPSSEIMDQDGLPVAVPPLDHWWAEAWLKLDERLAEILEKIEPSRVKSPPVSEGLSNNIGKTHTGPVQLVLF